MKVTNIIALGAFVCMAGMTLAVDLPEITEQPQSQIVSEGDAVAFSVESTGAPVDMTMLWVNPGTFVMGSPKDELGRSNDETQHQVTLTKGFWLGKYEVTQAQYKAIMAENPSKFVDDNLPVDRVTWNDAISFCIKLTEIERAAGRLPEGYEYTLPTEAQWEYACRAGTTTSLNSGKNVTSREEKCANMDEVGWYGKNSGSKSHSSGEKQGNNWGFYDMHGNVYEWCLDWYGGDYSTNAVANPTGPIIGKSRVLRSGSWYGYASRCRSARRDNMSPTDVDHRVGFRVALAPVQSAPAGGGWDFDVSLGEEPIYQWYKDGEAIVDATSDTYEIEHVRIADAGDYTVTIENAAGSVISDAATLTALEVLGGIAFREVVVDGNIATVTINVEPKDYVKSYFVEEKVPEIGTVIPKDGGIYTPSKDFIRWSFLDNNSRKISYTVTVSTNLTEAKNLEGTVTYDTNSQTIIGDAALDFTDRPHPADVNDDFDISTSEVSDYVTAWKYNKEWPSEPEEIPMTYAAKAAVIWVHGGEYTYDICEPKPACWNYRMITNTSLLAASASVTNIVNAAKRTITMNENKAEVSIKIEPASETSVYFVEERFSAKKALTVSNISDGGNYVPEKNAIRWSFLDNATRILTYTMEPPEGFGGYINMNGEVVFDDEVLVIEGDSETKFGAEITYELKDGALILTFEGGLESSEDGVIWEAIDAVSPYRVEITEGRKFYRSVKFN